jgi:serine/threonine protein kinase
MADRLASLDRRHDRLRQQLDDQRTWVPTEIPDVTRHSLSYGDIEKRGELGRGGNADVYRATGATDRGPVDLALKEPRMGGGKTLHTEVVERMMQEAETWQRLDDHDHIVGVVDYGSQPIPWIGMEYMDAGHLGERAGELPFQQALWTAIATTEAVRHAHRRGVAHLDLKPENILFRSVEGGWDVPKVADWGLSKHLLKHSKSVEGLSPQYAAPEQFDDSYGSTDDITDVYQLGAVFYELFTGQPVFQGQPVQVMNQTLSESPPAPSTVADVPSALDEILLTALEEKKSARYESVLYLRDDLRELFDHS